MSIKGSQKQRMSDEVSLGTLQTVSNKISNCHFIYNFFSLWEKNKRSV